MRAEHFVTGVHAALVALSRMHGELGGRHPEDQPSVADVDGSEPEDVADERAIGVGISTVKKNVRADDSAHFGFHKRLIHHRRNFVRVSVAFGSICTMNTSTSRASGSTR